MTPRLALLPMAAFVAALNLAGCEGKPKAPEEMPQRPVSKSPVVPTSPESQRARAYYARVQKGLLAQGLLRTDGGGQDAPFNERQLAENFIRIALFDEFVAEQNSLVEQTTESHLRRWEQPIRMAIEFGPSVPLAQQEEDRGNITAYMARLSQLTKLPIRVGAPNPNFTVLILNEDERRSAGPRVADLVPGKDPVTVRAITDMPESTYCQVFVFSVGKSSSYTQAVAIIRGEHPDLMRLMCIHEELAQSLGLANDSPAARPSIFNDDEEFALLTRQDEMMLRILYDPRLKPGMTPVEAKPIVEQIAKELMNPGTG